MQTNANTNTADVHSARIETLDVGNHGAFEYTIDLLAVIMARGTDANAEHVARIFASDLADISTLGAAIICCDHLLGHALNTGADRMALVRCGLVEWADVAARSAAMAKTTAGVAPTMRGMAESVLAVIDTNATRSGVQNELAVMRHEALGY